MRPAEEKHGGEPTEKEIQFPVESAITAQGITTQMFRIMKTGACIKLSQFTSRMYLRGDIAGDSEPKGSVLQAAWSVCLSEKSGGIRAIPEG